MAVQDDPKYAVWDAARKELEARTQYYNAVIGKYSPDHAFVRHVTEKLAEARSAYEKIVSEL